MDTTTYYGTEHPTTFTFMEFGEIDVESCKKKTWGYKMHQKAYDWFMLSRYANDVLAFNQMKRMIGNTSDQEIIDHFNREVHHDDEMALHLSKNIALAVTQDSPVLHSPSFYELGQTLFGCIEGMELYQDLLENWKIECPRIDTKKTEWYGVDISDMFNELAKLFHKEYSIRTMLLPSGLPERMDVFFSKGITLLYAVRTIADLFSTIRTGRLAVFDYSFSMDKVEDTTIGSGKTVRYLRLDDFLAALKTQQDALYINKSNSRYIPETNRVWLDCISGDERICQNYIDLDTKLRPKIAQRLSAVAGSARFLNNIHASEWLTVDQFMDIIRG
jgi:hypothetical protein